MDESILRTIVAFIVIGTSCRVILDPHSLFGLSTSVTSTLILIHFILIASSHVLLHAEDTFRIMIDDADTTVQASSVDIVVVIGNLYLARGVEELLVCRRVGRLLVIWDRWYASYVPMLADWRVRVEFHLLFLSQTEIRFCPIFLDLINCNSIINICSN